MLQLKLALKDIKRNIWLVIIFILQLSITVLYTSVLINELILDNQYKYMLNNTFNKQLTSFKMYYSESKILSVSSELNSLMAKTLDGNTNAYSYIPQAYLSDHTKINVVVGLGQFGKIFSLGRGYKSETLVALIGSKVRSKSVGDKICVGAFSINPIKISGILPEGASYMDSSGIHYLDNSIVILGTWESWKTNNILEYDGQLIANMNFIGASEETIYNYAQEVSRTTEKLDLVPMDAKTKIEKNLRQTQDQSLFFIFFIGIVIMIGVGLESSLTQLVEYNIHEYIIHRLYGAALGKIYLRNIIYVTIIILIPFLFAINIMRILPFMVHSIYAVHIAISVLLISVISIYPVFRLKNQDITVYLRREI